jgi:hypothetical protein
MAAIYCATQKHTVNSGLGIYDLTGSHRPNPEVAIFVLNDSYAAEAACGC